MKSTFKRSTAAILAALILAGAGSATVAMVGSSTVAYAEETTTPTRDSDGAGQNDSIQSKFTTVITAIQNDTTGTFSYSATDSSKNDNVITIEYTGSVTAEKLAEEFGKFLVALHNQSVAEITYDNVKYTWVESSNNPTSVSGDYKDSSGTTLVSVIKDSYSKGLEGAGAGATSIFIWHSFSLADNTSFSYDVQIQEAINGLPDADSTTKNITLTNGTYKLTKDVTLEDFRTETKQVNGKDVTTNIPQKIIVPANATVTLDLNNCTLANNQASSLVIYNEGNLTIKNGTISAKYIGVQSSAGTVNLNNVKVNATYRGVNCYDSSTVTIDKATEITADEECGVVVWGDADNNKKPTLNVYGTIEATGAYAISGNGTDLSGTTINIYDGANIKSTNATAIYHPQLGKLTMSGGSITGPVGIQFCSGKGVVGTNLSFTGGTITATGKDERESKTGDGEIPDGAAISVVNRDYPGGAPTVTINGGTFTSVDGDAIKAYTFDASATPKVSEWTEANKSLVIKGGTFSSDPKDYVASGYTATQSTNGTYTVAAIPAPAPSTPSGSSTTTDTKTDPDTGTKTETTTTTNPDGSKTEQKTETTTDGTKTETKTETKADGSATSTSTKTDATGDVIEKTESKTEVKADKSTVETTTTTLPKQDTKVENIVEKDANGTVTKESTTISSTKDDDLSRTIIESETKENSTGKTVQQVTTTVINKVGATESITEEQQISNIGNNTDAYLNIEKDGNGNTKTVEAIVDKVGATKGSATQATITKKVISQLIEAAGEDADVMSITINVTDEQGNDKYTLTVDKSALQPNKDLTIYKKDEETGELVMVNSKEYKTDSNGQIKLLIKSKNDFVLLSETQNKQEEARIKATIAPKKTKATIRKNKTTTMDLKNTLNTANVQKITYKSSKSSVATVNSNGKIKGKKSGTVTIKAIITLKNGSTKTVTMRLTVK